MIHVRSFSAGLWQLFTIRPMVMIGSNVPPIPMRPTHAVPFVLSGERTAFLALFQSATGLESPATRKGV